MGQYYKGAILSRDSIKNEKINVVKSFNCYSFDNGAKLMEHSYVGNLYVNAYEKQLAECFYGSPFVWIGDYAEDKFNENVYDLAYAVQEDNKNKNLKYERFEYVINFDKGMFVRIPKENELINNEWAIHPLPLLCSSGNGSGGGDFHRGKNLSLVGSWAYDRIAVANEIPSCITKELKVVFIEYLDGDDYEIVDR